ncbi:hypothetical protein GCM10012289_62600 [Nonomuraea cavernae]|uniref:HTH cro/C1-type domain-containing protein n=2 Tax=Nonomuraea cavernae TaxID=2045107 RepID=A0A917ZB35_9ACTN|nr:hypothetical protein GCM10012289_62600 [Nonomuraea cavernae]
MIDYLGLQPVTACPVSSLQALQPYCKRVLRTGTLAVVALGPPPSPTVRLEEKWMSNEIAEPLDVAEIGRRLREARASRNLSLDVVSAECGISPSLLSQVERGKVTPSLATLHSITQVLNIAMFDLFGSPADRPALIREGSRNVIRPPDSGGVSYELLSSGQLRNLQMIEMHLSAETGRFNHALSHAGEECLIVRRGSALIKVGTEELTLSAGDSLSYVARLPHQFRGLEDDTRLIISMTPPAF